VSEISNVIKVFERFLDETILEKMRFSRKGKVTKLQTIDDILALPISSYKFLSEKEAKILEDIFDVYDISEASKLNKEDPFKTLIELDSTGDPIEAAEMREKLKEQLEVLKKKFPDFETNLKKTITISSLILDIKQKEIEVGKEEQKVVVIGLDNAGKTAILTKFGGKLGIKDLSNLKPTKGVDRQIIKGENLDLIVWDMGGQEQYRENYLETPEKYFIEIDLLLYVIDIQDQFRFDESIQYFNEILDIIITLEQKPWIMVFLHKMDPDIKNDPEISLRIELLKDVLKENFRKKGVDLEYEVYLTSIYSMISNEPEFSKFIKEIMSDAQSLTDPTLKKVEGLGRILEETMNAVIRLSESISTQLNDLDSRLRIIETGAYQMAQSGTPIEIHTPKEEVGSGGSARSRVLDELKDLFAKKRGLGL
jgi:small GTP-binding protein